MTATHLRPLTTVAAVAALGLSLGIGAATAQGDDEFGAGIYEGTCDNPGDRALHDIGDLEHDDDDPNTIARTPVSSPVYSEDEGIASTLDDLTGAPHVVLVRAEDNANAPVVACGEIAGDTSGGTLMVLLDPVGDSGVSGVARFGPADDDDDGDDQTEVITEVTMGDGGMMATPAA